MAATLTYESHSVSDEAANNNFLYINCLLQILSKENTFVNKYRYTDCVIRCTRTKIRVEMGRKGRTEGYTYKSKDNIKPHLTNVRC
jgi:hypothetical protein